MAATQYFVSPKDGGESWMVKAENSDQSMFETKNRDEAIQKGKEIAQKDRGVLTIQNAEGKIEDTINYESGEGQ